MIGDLRPILIRSPENPAPVYSIAELLELSNSPLVLTSLTSKQKQGVVDVMAYIPQTQRQTKSRSSSPAKSNRSPSPATKSTRTSPPIKKAKKSPLVETILLPKVDTPSTPPRHRSSKRRQAETNSNTNPDSLHQQHHRTRHWGYAPSFHHNEDNWRAHPSLAIEV